MTYWIKFLRARFTIAVAVVFNMIRLCWGRRNQLGPWLVALGREQLTPPDPTIWQYAQRTSRCLGCGLCDAYAPAQVIPSAAFLSWTRHPGDALLEVQSAVHLDGMASELEKICPARLRVEDIRRMLTYNARALTTPPA